MLDKPALILTDRDRKTFDRFVAHLFLIGEPLEDGFHLWNVGGMMVDAGHATNA